MAGRRIQRSFKKNKGFTPYTSKIFFGNFDENEILNEKTIYMNWEEVTGQNLNTV